MLQYQFDSDEFLDAITEEEIEEVELEVVEGGKGYVPFMLRECEDFVPNELEEWEKQDHWARAYLQPETLAWLRAKDKTDRHKKLDNRGLGSSAKAEPSLSA